MSSNIYLLSPTPYEGVEHLPMIRFDLLASQIDFSRFDALILTSKQGVKALDEISGGAWRILRAAAIGRQTAMEIEKRGGEVIYVASKAYGDVLAKELAERFDGYRWLYPRPKVVVSKIAAKLREWGIEVEEVVIYETSCMRYKKNRRPQSGSVLIFTAPSVVRCFFENFEWDSSWKAVAIGEKTAQAFPKSIEIYTPTSPSLATVVELSKNLVRD